MVSVVYNDWFGDDPKTFSEGDKSVYLRFEAESDYQFNFFQILPCDGSSKLSIERRLSKKRLTDYS